LIEELAAPSGEGPAGVAGVEALPSRRWRPQVYRAGVVALALLAALAASLPRPPAGALARAGLVRLGEGLVSVDAPPIRVDAVAVHGGGGTGRERERAALALLRDGSAGAIVALGGPLPPPDPDRTYAGAVRRRLTELAAPADRVVLLPEGLSTRAELVALRRLAEERGWRRLALSTSSWHTLRVRLTAAEVFAGSGISWAIVAGPDEQGADWWSSADRRRIVVGEWLKIAQMVAWPSDGRL
jgi:uncharacterized SAM-binding protein YcdF (DUF218 family)